MEKSIRRCHSNKIRYISYQILSLFLLPLFALFEVSRTFITNGFYHASVLKSADVSEITTLVSKRE
jgi:hypothetical protein